MDFDAINAALRLGDRPLPPIGAVIERLSGSHYVVQFHHGKNKAYLRRCSGVVCVDDGYVKREIILDIIECDILRGEFYQVVGVPRNAPPFEEWVRSDYGGSQRFTLEDKVSSDEKP